MNNEYISPILDEDMTRIQAITYTLSKLKERFGESTLRSLKVVKLIALADVYNLRQDGRTITDDEYFAVKNGPMPSTIANIVTFDAEYLSDSVRDEAGKYIQACDGNLTLKQDYEEHDFLSEFNIECLDHVINAYGHLSAEELIDGNGGDNVHAFDAWKKHNIRDYGERAEINLEDFFENDGPVQVSEEALGLALDNYKFGAV